MKVFVTGVTGQLGHDVMLEAMQRGHIVIASCRRSPKNLFESTAAHDPNNQVSHVDFVKLDLADKFAVKRELSRWAPDAIIHCAAWTAVDTAEDAQNHDAVYSANVLAAENLAEAAREIDAKLLYLSTDYVFDGQGTQPWQPDDQNYAPLNVYGKSKLEGELAVSSTLEKYFIVRTAWMFGKNGKNFIKTMLEVGKKHDAVRVVNDQVGTPTYTKDLALLLVDMIETVKYGYYHATNSEEMPGGYISWYDFCCEIYRQAGMNTRIIPVTSEEYGLSRAKRPLNSRLDKSKLAASGFRLLPDWKDALSRYLNEIGEKKNGTD